MNLKGAAIRWWMMLALVATLAGPRTALAAPALGDPGPYSAGWRSVSAACPGGVSINGLLFYPAVSALDSAARDASGAPYPALVFGHGFTMTPENYRSTLAHLASHGYLVIAPNLGMSSDHAAFAAALRCALTYLETQNAAPAAFLYRRVAVTRFGAFGHSMGGGAALLAAAADPRIRAVAGLAPAETRPSAVAAAADLRVPLRLVAGTADMIAPLAQHQQPMYDAAHAPKQLAVLQGAGHCGYLDSPPTGCDMTATLDRAAQQRLARYQLTGWFDYYLKKDRTLEAWVWGSALDADPLVSVRRDGGPPRYLFVAFAAGR